MYMFVIVCNIMLLGSIAWGSDKHASCEDLKTNGDMLHPIQQEIIKFAIKIYGIEYFTLRQEVAEEQVARYNKIDRDNHTVMVPSWRLETVFHQENSTSDQLTKTIYEAVVQAQKQHGYKQTGVIPGKTIYKMQKDGSIRCRTNMTSNSYFWAKKQMFN